MVNRLDAFEEHSTLEHNDGHQKGPRINAMQPTVKQMKEPAVRKPLLHFFRGALLEDAWRRSRVTAIEQVEKSGVSKTDVPGRLRMMSASALADGSHQWAFTAGHHKADQRQVDVSLSPLPDATTAEATPSSHAEVPATPQVGGNALKEVPVSDTACVAARAPSRKKKAARRPIATQPHDAPILAVAQSPPASTQPVVSPCQLHKSSDLYKENDLPCCPSEQLQRPSMNQNFTSLESSTVSDSPQPDLRQNPHHSRTDTERNQRRGSHFPPAPRRMDRTHHRHGPAVRKRVKIFRPFE
ncbi:uncharacterized protein LOC142785320 isoform X2 [Rhipicephalus microplus]|uniref:uncharacterized protein LOC142785320 isoform X2 n=1 Tax=Rhipicephalus microplus TaxID=6941 RepID=UPI003F6D818E